MGRKVKAPKKLSKLELIQAMRRATAPGTYPGQNRARVFKDRKKEANKRACRLKVNHR
jgi:hypothetical protein